MIKIAVCDDNKAFAEALEEELTALCAREISDAADCRICPAFTSAVDVLSYLDSESFDIIFLDIDMPKITGFDLAEEIVKRYPETLIIFVSAYDNFVYSSFAYSPFRFLRKSHLSEELPGAFLKAIEKVTQKSKSINFICTEGPVSLRTSDIVSFESDKNYFTISCFSGEKYKCRGTIASLEPVCLGDSRYFRIHSAYVINLEHVRRVIDSGVIMSDGSEIPISRTRLARFKEAYMQFVRRRYSK